MKRISIIIGLLLFSFLMQAQVERKTIRKGNKSYNNSEFADAEVFYKKAEELQPDDYKVRKNLGATLFRMENFESAAETYTKYAVATRNGTETADAFYNLGTAQLQAGDYQKSIESLKQSLRTDPKNDDARYNLQVAQYMLSKQQQGGSGGGGGSSQNQDQQQNQQQNEDEKDQQQNQDQNQSPDQKMSKEDAERILQALENDEKDLQEDINKEKARLQRVQIEKNW
jgi:tetratricopeptide (TPR) repeat protein